MAYDTISRTGATAYAIAALSIIFIHSISACGRRTSKHATIGSQDTLPDTIERTIHFGFAWDSTADPGFAYFGAATFSPARSEPPLAEKRWFHGMTTKGKMVEVMVESVDPAPEHSYEPSLHAVFRHGGLDSAEVALFWDTEDTVTVLTTLPAALDSSATALLKGRALALHQAALAEAGDVIAPHDGVELSKLEASYTALAPDVVAVLCRLTFKQGDSTVDDRATVFFLYSRAGRRVLFETFGHPEWGTDAPHVISVWPVAFFTIARDSRVYLLGGRAGAWESNGSWVIFDLRTGKVLMKEGG